MPVLVVQMGHVGRPRYVGDRASVGTAGEQDFTRSAAAACVRLLNRGGWTVKIINADPGYPNPATLGGNREFYRGDAFVAIHCDGSDNQVRDGGSFGYRTTEGREFAQIIRRAYMARGWPNNWEPDNYTSNLSGYYGTGLAADVGNRRAVIFETGFLTNPADRARLLAPDGADRVALAIGDALGITQPPAPAPSAPALEVDTVMRMHLARTATDPRVWLGNGMERRVIEDPVELENIRHWLAYRYGQPDTDVETVGDMRVLGVPITATGTLDVDEAALAADIGELLIPAAVAALERRATDLTPEELDTIARVVNDEQDRRNRDNDPGTGTLT